MDYEKLTDEEIINLYRNGDAKAGDYILNKYKTVVSIKAKSTPLFIMGGDTEDLIQEGMIGLFKGIQDFDPKKNASFATFADLCIKRQMIKAINAGNTKKNSPLNSYISLFIDSEEDDDWEYLLIEGSGSPEKALIEEENVKALLNQIENTLSKMEKEVFDLMIQGFDYKTIASKLGKSEKSVDNALQRIKNKIKSIVDDNI